MKQNITGGCACGAVRYQCDAPPVRSFKCHCRTCQQITGSGYLAGMFVPASAFTITAGEPKYYTDKADSGADISRGFCANCGSPICTKFSRVPKMIGIAAGTLDDPSLFKPTLDIFTSMAQPWDEMNSASTKFPLGMG